MDFLVECIVDVANKIVELRNQHVHYNNKPENGLNICKKACYLAPLQIYLNSDKGALGGKVLEMLEALFRCDSSAGDGNDEGGVCCNACLIGNGIQGRGGSLDIRMVD